MIKFNFFRLCLMPILLAGCTLSQRSFDSKVQATQGGDKQVVPSATSPCVKYADEIFGYYVGGSSTRVFLRNKKGRIFFAIEGVITNQSGNKISSGWYLDMTEEFNRQMKAGSDTQKIEIDMFQMYEVYHTKVGTPNNYRRNENPKLVLEFTTKDGQLSVIKVSHLSTKSCGWFGPLSPYEKFFISAQDLRKSPEIFEGFAIPHEPIVPLLTRTMFISDGSQPQSADQNFCGGYADPGADAGLGGPSVVPQDDFYAVLEVRPEATLEQIKDAYKNLAKQNHPDKAGNENTAKMQQINEAFEILSDSKKRRQYDQIRARMY